MVAKKAKTYKLSDFFTKDKNEESTKMALMYDDEDTGCFLMVKGIEAKSMQRARITTQVNYADAAEKSATIADKIERAQFERETKEQIEIVLANELVTDWSFGNYTPSKLLHLLDQNQGLAFAIIAHATTPSNYLEKK